jgi:hypothetical protein
MSDMSVDVQSYALAEHFLQDDDESDLSDEQRKKRRMSLAQAIQRAVEDWIEDETNAKAASL